MIIYIQVNLNFSKSKRFQLHSTHLQHLAFVFHSTLHYEDSRNQMLLYLLVRIRGLLTNIHCTNRRTLYVKPCTTRLLVCRISLQNTR